MDSNAVIKLTQLPFKPPQLPPSAGCRSSFTRSSSSRGAFGPSRARQITRLVGILDGFNRYRFHNQPQLIVAWESAKHVAAAAQPKRVEDAAPPLTLIIPDRESAA